MSKISNSFYPASAGADRIIELLDQRPQDREPDIPLPLSLPRGQVSFAAVSFRYPGTDRPALSEVSFDGARDETVALVGASGAGKSTIAKLLLRFYDPDSGSLRLDGHDLRLSDLRDNVAVVLQETRISSSPSSSAGPIVCVGSRGGVLLRDGELFDGPLIMYAVCHAASRLYDSSRSARCVPIPHMTSLEPPHVQWNLRRRRRIIQLRAE
jgi:hypothetical protein